MIKCSQMTCENEAFFYYHWMDGRQLYCCPTCLVLVSNVAKALGFMISFGGLEKETDIEEAK